MSTVNLFLKLLSVLVGLLTERDTETSYCQMYTDGIKVGYYYSSNCETSCLVNKKVYNCVFTFGRYGTLLSMSYYDRYH